MVASPYQKYQQSSVQTATPGKLIVMLYEGAIRFVRQSIEAIDNKDIPKANQNLIKAQNIIHELTASLDYNYPIAEDLGRLYEYMMHQLIEANIKKDSSRAAEVLSHLTELKNAWVQAEKINMQTEHTQHG